ncbi:MAG: mechanosensitive ion channel domain-containing protein [Bacteroidota bacterium]
MDIKDQKQNIPQGNVPDESKVNHKWFVSGYILFALLSLACYLILRLHMFSFSTGVSQLLTKLTLASCLIFVALTVSRFAESTVTRHAHTKSQGYNLVRVIRLLTIFVVFLIFVSFLNANWYTAAASLGIISLILGFALQTPIASLIGWVYIVIRSPFKVGDRVQIGDFKGDVVEISYLDSTLWEFAGEYLSNDLPSGRLIRFPNSLVFQQETYNYSWKKFPYIWNEIPFHVAYESDLNYIEETIRKIAKAELGDMDEKVRELREMIKNTAVDELEVKEYPYVQFRINANTWVEVLLIYLVEPKHSGTTRTRLIRNILAELVKQPDRVMFPKSSSR